jgi:phenylacetate-CoA ligase
LNRHYLTAIADAVDGFGARWLRCYPSAGYDLARLCQEQGRSLRFGGVITGSEPVYDVQRGAIEKAFGAKLYAGYGMAERVIYAAECEYGRLHANLDYGHVEIVDASGNATKDIGWLVGTTFHNHAMPLLRYRLDDTARWSAEPCPCGRTHPVLTDIEGRMGDQLLDLDGNPVNATVITFVFKETRCLQRAQVAQVARDLWEVRVVPDSGYDESVGTKLIADFHRLVTPRLNLKVCAVDKLENLASGKFKWVSQEWRPDDRSRP